MCLRFHSALILGAALSVSSLAHAKTPAKSTPEPAKVKTPAPSPSSASAVAQAQAIFSYCESVDPHSIAKYIVLQALVLSGDSPIQILADERTEAYRSEFNTIRGELSAIPVSTGVASCRSAIAGI